MSAAAPELGWYVYGVVGRAPDAAPAVARARALMREHKPTLIEAGELTAIASRVPLDEFAEEELPARLNDPAWLAEKVTAHEDVLEHALAVTPVVPLRFGTIYRDEPAVRRFLTENEEGLQEALGRVGSFVEVGVKAYLDHERLQRVLVAEPPGDGPAEATGTGRAYLLRRQSERRAREEAEAFAAECAAASHAAVAAAAAESRTNAPTLDGMILNAAYLAESVAAVEAAVATLRERYGPYGVRYDVTGPWPAYNFVAAGA
jgi:Gas vesicle synthesis protein GvpL/GvpF